MYCTDQPIEGENFQGTSDIRTGLNTRQFCGDDNTGCYGQVHADGEVLGGALWKVRARLQTAHGSSAGGAIADLLFNSWMNAYNDGQIKTIIETHWLTLDDDDGNINNGTPNYLHIDGGFRDQGFPGFDLPFVVISNVTDLPTTPDEVGPYIVGADIYAEMNPPLAAADMFYRVDGGSFVQVPMTFVSGTSYTSSIPGQTSVARIEYYISGEDSLGNVETFPTGAPTSLMKFFVGVESLVLTEDFEGGVGGWTHVDNGGAQDDWQHSSQVGSPNGAYGKAGDPSSAYSGTNIWGNDLGQTSWNGEYANDVDNSLLSPILDMSGISGATLTFQRWLTIESGMYDEGNVKVNGTTVWTNPYSTDLVDTSWQEVEVDISAIADGNSAVQLEWNLVSDGGVVFGGWNVDDVKVFSLIESPPTAGFSGTPTAGPAPLSVSFTDLSIGNITSWNWNFGDTTTSTTQNPSHVYSTSGFYTVSLTVTGPGGSDLHTITDYIEVTGTGSVTAHFSGTPTSGYAPLTVNFTDESLGTITGWSWDFGDSGTSTAQHPSHLYSAPGTYTVSLMVTGPGSSAAYTLIDYITAEDATPTADFSGTPLSGTAPLTVNFSDESTGPITSWSWDFGDSGTSTAQDPTHLYTTPGTYSVSLTVVGPGGNDSLTRFDYIEVDHQTPTADFSGTPTSGGMPLTVDFTDLSGGTITSWSWNFGDTGTSTAQHPTHIYGAAGTYTVSLTVDGPGGNDTFTRVDYIQVTAGASATTRNGSGVNPDIFTSTSLPILGMDWTSEVDAASVGANGFVFVFVYAGGLPGTPTAFGELLLDPASAWLFTDLAIAVGGTSLHDIRVPSDPVYLGNQAYAQAYLNSVAPSGQLTNAIDLVLGY
jgi:PKD repeat protein